jgi:hypothetical protein
MWMRYGRGALVATVAAAALVLPGGAGAKAKEDSVTGTVTGAVGDLSPLTVQISARSGPGGENPTGRVTLIGPEPGFIFIGGPVTCLNVQGNVALVKIQADTGAIGVQLSMRITDNVTDNAGSLTPDAVDMLVTNSASDECASPEPVYLLSHIQSGDVVVVDDSKCRKAFEPDSKKPICPPPPPV